MSFCALFKSDYIRAGGWPSHKTWGDDDDWFMTNMQAVGLRLLRNEDARFRAPFHPRDMNNPWYAESDRKAELINRPSE